MLRVTFPHNFHSEIIPDNKEELVYELENAELDKHQSFEWNDGCSVKLERLSIDQKYTKIFKPSLDIFFDELNVNPNQVSIFLHEIWRNTYEKGFFQEIHDHTPLHLSGVVFLTDEQEGDSRFFFSHRYGSEIPREWRDLKCFADDRLYIKAERGKVLLFPSYNLHGVTVHKTNNIRKTVSFNFIFNHH